MLFRSLREVEVDDALLDVRSTRALGNDKLSEVRAICSHSDVLADCDNVDREVERQRELGRGIVAPHSRTERSGFGEAEVKLVQANSVDDVEDTLVRENSLDSESFDALVKPSDLERDTVRYRAFASSRDHTHVGRTSAVTLDCDIAVLAVKEAIEHQ